MKWQLGWSELAQQQLAQIWLEASDRDAVSHAVSLLDEQLIQDPLEVGESRDANQRITFQPPLAITFIVEQRLSLVTVIRVYNPNR